MTGLEMISNEMNYLLLLAYILAHGKQKMDRTGVGTTGIFGAQLRFDLRHSFPLLTTKKVFFRAVVEELLWMLRGDTNVRSLQAENVHIWDEWATKEQCAKFGRKEGDLGPVYGHQWRNFGSSRWVLDEARGYREDGIDQIARVIADIQKNPYSRRHIVTGWNPKEADEVALPPCHTLFQFHVMEGELSCHMYQRSADMFLGVPFNIASYALLTTMVADVTGLTPGDLVISYGDAHIYNNHIDQVRQQLLRSPRAAPKLSVKRLGMGVERTIDDFMFEDFKLEGYDPHPAIKGEVAV